MTADPAGASATPAAADVLRDAVAALHMAGIKTGAQYEQLVSEVITVIYARPGGDHA